MTKATKFTFVKVVHSEMNIPFTVEEIEAMADIMDGNASSWLSPDRCRSIVGRLRVIARSK